MAARVLTAAEIIDGGIRRQGSVQQTPAPLRMQAPASLHEGGLFGHGRHRRSFEGRWQGVSGRVRPGDRDELPLFLELREQFSDRRSRTDRKLTLAHVNEGKGVYDQDDV